VRPFRSLSLYSFTLATPARRNPSSSDRRSGDVDHSSANQRSAIHDGHDHDPSVVEIDAADVLAESKGLVGGDHPTMLRNGVVGRLAEFLGARRGDRHRGAKGRNGNVFHRNLSDVDVPNPPGFVK
jgi:hypothetical protein